MPEDTKSINYFRAVIGPIFLLGSFGIFYLVLSGKTNLDWKDVALMIVGALMAKVGTIVDWTFGSSQGSEQKTEAMVDTAKVAAAGVAKSVEVLANAEVAEVERKKAGEGGP